MLIWPDIENLKINITLPRIKDDLIKLILNKATKPQNDLFKSKDKYFPAIMTRKQKSSRTLMKKILYKKLHILIGNDKDKLQLDEKVVTH